MSERGQDTVEWGGLLLLVALMLAALLASGVLASFASGVECGVRESWARRSKLCESAGSGRFGSERAVDLSGSGGACDLGNLRVSR